MMTMAQIDLLRRRVNGLSALAEGRRKPVTPAQRRFVDVMEGRRRAVTDYEKAYLAWRATSAAEPGVTLDMLAQRIEHEEEIAARAARNAAALKALAKPLKRKKPLRWRKSMTAAEAKRPSRKRWTEADIERIHRVSGLDRIKARIVRGGGVNPR